MVLPKTHQFLHYLQKEQPIRLVEGFSFRRATDDDAPAIRALFALSQKEFGFEYDFNGRESDLMEISAKYGQPGAYFGLLWDEVNDTLAGMAAIRPFPQDNNQASTLKTAELCRTYIYPEYRGQGIGRQLIKAMVDLAKTMDYDRLVLESHTALIDALRLYKRLGFQVIPPYTPNEPDYSDYAAELVLR